jgi:hypothetical protein
MVAHTGYDLGMGGLDEQSADASDEGGDVADDAPGHRPRSEEARIPAVGETMGKGIGSMTKRGGGRRDDSTPDTVG